MSKIHPRNSPGRFRNLRNAISVMLQAILFITPWLTWGGRQAILFDVPARKLHVLGWTFWPQETYFMLLLLISAALTLFLITSLAGRVWCGYACPQTLLSQAFILVERITEGDSYQRVRLDNGPWNANKISRKAAKYSAWLTMSIFLGFTFAGYYTPIRALAADVLSGHAKVGTVMVIGFFTLVSLAFFGVIRTRFCHTMCPYARFQGAMFDTNSLIVGYDATRGEPRGKAKDPTAGSCVDCKMCVQVCPAGIDIRNGLQFECISCAACVDACDTVMDKLGRERGLVRYASENELEGKPTSILRARPAIYAVLLTLCATIFGVLLWLRPPIEVDVMRDGSNGPFTRTADGRIANLYNLRVINKQLGDRSYAFEVKGIEGAELMTSENPMRIAGETGQVDKVFVAVPEDAVASIAPIEFRVWDVEHPERVFVRKTTFVAGGSR
ncbi:MAG: cytochrome c oxidase accessory protein CcoG [Candidatus Eremiobacteraeota bacterium]|nr:cytochrome c oxidase accessory protein CcoG [Candidatus Eremiobacteraeota bacterium]